MKPSPALVVAAREFQGPAQGHDMGYWQNHGGQLPSWPPVIPASQGTQPWSPLSQ